MPGLSFTDQPERLRRIVRSALDGALYQGSYREEDGSHLIIEARRPDGLDVRVRFRGVTSSDATLEPPQDSILALRDVRGSSGCLIPAWLFPRVFANVPGGSCRVRIEAGDARLDIVCQDAEWWENRV